MGTLKNLLLKPYSILYIMTSRTLAWAIINILKIFIIIFILKFIFPIKIVMNPSIFFVLCLSMIGVYGLSLILMALTMIYTKTASFGVVIEYTLLFLSGLIFPIEKMPLILKIISKFSPLYLGVNITNKICENQFYFTDLYPLAVQSCCYLFLGYILFKIIIKFNYNYSMRY